MINYNASDFVGILITIGLFAYLTNLLQWGLFQIIKDFFIDDDDEKISKVFHHHFHYKAKK